MAPTPNIQRIVNRLNLMWPGQLRFEYYNRRHIGNNPLRRWSQHAGSEPDRAWYGNAADVFDPKDSYDSRILNEVHAYLDANRTELRIRTLLWRVKNHWNHIHVDTYPKLADAAWRQPPPKGPVVTFNEAGEKLDTYEDDMPQFTEEEAEELRELVAGLKARDSSGWGLATNGVDLIRKERQLPLHEPEPAGRDVLKRGDIVQLGNPPST